METEPSVIYLPDGTVVMPGGIDIHVHSRVPDATHKEDFTTLTKAAINGGMITVIDMPNAPALADTKERFLNKVRIAEKAALYSKLGFHFLLTDENGDELDAVKNEAIAYKLFLRNSTGGHGVKDPERIVNRAPRGKVIMFHADDEVDYLQGVELVRKNDLMGHFCHVQSKEAVAIIAEAKKAGLNITAGVTPHHLALTRRDLRRYGAFAMMLPALRDQDDQDALIKGLKDGDIDQIESDHAPHLDEEKLGEEPPNGVPVLEQTIPLLFTLLKQGVIDSVEQIVKWTHTNPKNRFNIPVDPRDKIYVATDYPYRVKQEWLQTKSAASNPFLGWLMTAAVMHVELGDERAMNYQIIMPTPKGSIIHPLTRV